MAHTFGVSETQGSYAEALRLIGKQDPNGRTIGIVRVEEGMLQVLPLAIRTIGFLIVLALPVIQQPFGWLPESGPWIIGSLASWELFSTVTWLAAVLIYTAYFVMSLVKNRLYTGQPGAVIHFVRHKKIIQSLEPGEWTLILDPRVRPFAVVSTKLMVLEMQEVEGNTKDNITQKYRGALRIRVNNTYRLLEQGGFEKFVRQLRELYESIIKDLILEVKAREFNRFLVEPVAVPETRSESITKRLAQLESSDLSVDLLTRSSEIEEMDVSKFDLAESEHPHRKRIIPRLQRLADSYGIDILDHVPTGNLTSEEYLRTLALPLVSSITRLRQATETLRDIIEEEIDEEITARVADLKLGVLETEQIIREIESITKTLGDTDNERAIVEAREVAIENTAEEVLASATSLIESLQARIRAKEIDTTGIERYISEMESIYDQLEEEIDRYVPQIGAVVTGDLKQDDLVPRVDVIEALMERTGTRSALRRLKDQVEDVSFGDREMEREIRAIEARADEVNVENVMQQIQEALGEVSSESGISAEEYSPERVQEKIDQITKEADVTVDVDSA